MLLQSETVSTSLGAAGFRSLGLVFPKVLVLAGWSRATAAAPAGLSGANIERLPVPKPSASQAPVGGRVHSGLQLIFLDRSSSDLWPAAFIYRGNAPAFSTSLAEPLVLHRAGSPQEWLWGPCIWLC